MEVKTDSNSAMVSGELQRGLSLKLRGRENDLRDYIS